MSPACKMVTVELVSELFWPAVVTKNVQSSCTSRIVVLLLGGVDDPPSHILERSART